MTTPERHAPITGEATFSEDEKKRDPGHKGLDFARNKDALSIFM